MCSPGCLDEPVVGEREGPRPPLLEPLQRVPPGVQVHLRRGRRGHHHVPLQAHAREVPAEGHPALRLEEGDVVGGVTRGPGAVQPGDPLAVLDRVEVLLGYRQHLSEQFLEALAEHPPGARQQAAGVRQVGRPAGVDVDLQLRPACHQRPGRAGVVEMDVGQQQRSRGLVAQSLEQLWQAGTGAAVHEHVPAQPRPHRPRAPVVAQVDDARVHLSRPRRRGRSTLSTRVLQRVRELS